MSFRFNWPDFDPTFYAEAKQQLETALNKEKRSKHIADYIFVNELNMGCKPPELEILEICELSTDYFRGILKLTYCGDAFIEMKTKIQVNPLYTSPSSHHEINHYHPFFSRHTRPNMLTAAQPLVIPMLLSISDIQLSGIIVLSVSKTKGTTLVFKNDALNNLHISSTFDILPHIKSFLQKRIESQLRTFLHDTFPLIVHEYSLHHINDQQQQQQQQKYNINSHTNTNIIDFGCTNSIPDLTLSPSDCFSDTSSECMSHDGIDVDNNNILATSPPISTGFYQFKDDVYNSLRPILTTPHCPTSFVKKNTNLSTGDHTHCQCNYDLPLTTSPLSSAQPFLQKQPSCIFMPNNSDDGNASDRHQTRYHDDGISTTSNIFFDQPILISACESHGLIQRMTEISTSSQTLIIDSDNNWTSSIHKTTTMNGDTHGKHQQKQIPRRRIIKWNA